MEKFFQLKKYGTKPSTEIIAGLTTFFAMAYIIFVNPAILSQTGMPSWAVFLATIIASVVGTLIMWFYANVPYASAPGMWLNAFFTFVICGALNYTWQQGLAMVFVCGLINVLITVTKLRKEIIKNIPQSLQYAIGGGIWVFVAYVGIKNAGLLSFTANPGTYTMLWDTVNATSAIVPSLATFNTPGVLLSVFGLLLMSILVIRETKGAIFISIMVTAFLSIILACFGLETNIAVQEAITHGSLDIPSLSSIFSELKITFWAAFWSEGLGSLFHNFSALPVILMSIFSLSLGDTFDTIWTFIGTGKRTGIFDNDEEKKLTQEGNFKSRLDRALFADSVATSIGAIVGTSNTTTYVESVAGIWAGGRTGMTAVVVALLFLLSIFLAPVFDFIPTQATAPALILVGIMMTASFKHIKWDNITEAIPAFFTAIFMAFCYNISYGIGAGFIFYCLSKLATGKSKEVSPLIWVVTGLFILNFVVLAVI